MNNQKLQQKQKLNVSSQQIQFMNLLQDPITELIKNIEKELEENPALEEEEEEEIADSLSQNFFNSTKENTIYTTEFEGKSISLSEYLHQQLIDLELSDKFMFLVSYLINSLDDSGFLNRDLYSIQTDISINNSIDVTESELLKAISIIQQLEPVGVGAKDLQECLIIQLKKKHPNEKTALNIITEYYTFFVNKNFEKLTKNLSIRKDDLKSIYLIIESLNPIPSRGFSKEHILNEYIKPDFIISIKNNNPDLVLNKAIYKGLKISPYYQDLLKKTSEKETKDFLKKNIDKAVFFKEALIKREITLKKVMLAIVKIQKSYFLTGDEKKLIPMTLSDVANIVKMDISTISRVSNSKYIETEFGTFKVKELFSEGYKKENGEIISNKEIKKRLKEIIDLENKEHPLTDEAISDLLSKEGYEIARRTVTKYRKSLRIQIAKKRRSL